MNRLDGRRSESPTYHVIYSFSLYIYTRECVRRTLYINLNLFYDYIISEKNKVYVCIDPHRKLDF